MGAFENVTDKIVLLLNKTMDSLLLDLEKEFSGVRKALEQLEAQTKGTPSGVQDGLSSAQGIFDSCTQVVKATFAQVGLDISQCESTEDFATLLEKPLALLNRLAEQVEKVAGNQSDPDYADLFETLYDTVKDLRQLVEDFRNVEFAKMEKELKDLLGDAYEQFDAKELAMSLLEYILITLLRNGREVFSDEIKYVKFQANEIYTRIDTAVKDVRGTIEGEIQSCLKQFEKDADQAASLAKTLFRESVDDLEDVYNTLSKQVKDGIDSALTRQEADELLDVYRQVSDALSKTYAILDFFGIVGKKTVEIKLPKKFIAALEGAAKTVTGAIEDATQAIGGCVRELTEDANGAISYAEGAVKAVAGPVHEKVQQAAGAIDSLMDTSFASLDLTTDLVNLPAVSIPDFSADITAAGSALSGALSKYVGGGLDYAKGFSFPITIPTFRWEKVDKIFTDPKAYFLEQYPVDSIEDAEAIAAQVIDIARLFNPDIPDFSSLRNMLESLLRELGEKVLTLAKDAVSEAKRALWEQVKPLMTMIRKVLDLLEEMYESLKREAHNIIQEIKRRFIEEVVNPLSKEADAALDEVKDAVRKIKEQIESIQAPDTLEKLYEDIVRPAVEEAIEKSTAPGPATAEKLGAFAKEVMTAWGTGVYTHLANFFDEKAWKDRLDGTISALEATFAGDVAAVKSFLTPSSLDDLRNTGGRFKDLRKSLDINEYIKIVSEAFDNVSIPNPELYYEGFKQAVTAILGEAKKVGAKFDESQVTTFASDVATASWTRFRDQLLQPLFRELKKNALTTVRQVVREVIDQILDQLPSYKDIKAIESGSNGASGTVRLYTDKADERITDVKNLTPAGKGGNAGHSAGGGSKPTATTSTDKHFDIDIAKDWLVAAGKIAAASAKFSTTEMSYADIITLVVSLYKAIPESAKEFLEDILPSLPDNDFTKELSGFFDQMDFKGDLDNTFAIVTVVDAKSDKGDKEKDKKKEDGKTDFNASALLQLVVFAGEIPVEKDPREPDPTVKKKGETNDPDEKDGEPKGGELKDGEQKDVEKKEKEQKDGEKKEEEEKEPALFFRVILKGQAGLTFAIGENHTMSLSVSGGVGGKVETIDEKTQGMLQNGIGFHITKDWEFHGDDNWEALNAMFLMDFKRKVKKGEKNALQVFDTKYLSMEVGNYPQLFYLGFAKAGPSERFEEFGIKEEKEKDKEEGKDKGKEKKGDEKGKIPEGNSLQVGYIGAIREACIQLHTADIAFVKEVVTDDIALGFDTYLWYDYHKGFDFGGDVRLHLVYDLNHKKLGPLTIDSFTMDAGSVEGEKGKLALAIGTTFQVDFHGALVIAVEDLGIGFKLNYLDEDGKFGDFDLDAGLRYPSGLGITVDASVVKGGGHVSLDRDTGEFFGYLFLEILEKVSVKAVLLCDPGTAKDHDFSLVALISAIFNPGIQLGMGFSLTAVGGAVGLNRAISRQAIQNGVRTGTLGQVFFVGDPGGNLSSMKNTVVKYFPAKKDQFFFGLLGQISFAPVLKCDFGLLLQLPSPTEVIIVGAMRVKAAEGVLNINSYFAGGIDFSEGMWFVSSLVDSQIVGISISGDMVFRLNWGGQKGFLLSMGGFHPAYRPEEGLDVGKLNRLAMRLDYDILNVSFEHYLAVTSNTFQIGARLDVQVGWKEFCIKGFAGFDTLFQFDPFLFLFAASAMAHVTVGNTNLLHTTLDLVVQGPAPWMVVGEAYFKFLGIKVNVDFTLTWGKRAPKLPSKQVEVFPLLLEAWNDARNWRVDNSDLTGKMPVFLIGHASEELILQPDGSLTFNQSAVPFYTEETTAATQEKKGKLDRMDLCNDAVPSDYDILCLESVSGTDSYRTEVNDFAPALYRHLTIREKLASESYVKYNSGFTLDERDKRTFQGKTAQITRDTQFQFCSLADQRRESPGTPGSGSLKAVARLANGRLDRHAFERYVAALDKRSIRKETTK